MKFNHLNVPDQWKHYWTRYPEGYTILEALISWVSQVDDMADNQNALNATVEQFRNELDDFVGQFNERLQDEVTTTLADWQQSGFLNVVINEALDTKYHEMDTRLTEQLAQSANDLEDRGINVTDPRFGAKCDAFYRNPTDKKVYKDKNYTTLATDDTTALQKAVNYAMKIGGKVKIPRGMLVTDTIILSNTEFIKAIELEGNGANDTTIWFENTVVDKPLFDIDTNVSYLKVSNLQFYDVNIHISKAFYFKDLYENDGSSGPNWKHYFSHFRILNFKEGIRWDGDLEHFSGDTHLSEVTYFHGKFRNCKTAIIFNNTQAVNHNLFAVDIENDGITDQTEHWKMLKFERGCTVNHYGGSIIGSGSYIWWEPTVGGEFQATSQIMSDGIRHEVRGKTPEPTIHHSENSKVTMDGYFRVIQKNITLITVVDNHDYIKTGGRSYIEVDGFRSNKKVFANTVLTKNLVSMGTFGQIKLNNVNNIEYKRTKEIAYGSSELPQNDDNYIPAQITRTTELNRFSKVNNVIKIDNQAQDVLGVGYNVANTKTLVFKPSSLSSGFGLGSSSFKETIQLPAHSYPLKFKILSFGQSRVAPITMNLIFVIGGVEHVVATIKADPEYGLLEAPIKPPSGALNMIYSNPDGEWDGKVIVEKTGTVTAFSGLFMIDYI